MKRGRHDAHYDEVRKHAGYARARREFPDEQEDREIADRVAQSNAEFQARMHELEQQDQQRSADLAARMAERSREISRRMLLREYEEKGLTPPEGMLISLPLLIRLGWRIEDVNGSATLIKPMPKQSRRRTREDYEAERANAEGS